MFVTGAFFLVDPVAASIDYVFAGHEPSIVIDASGGLGKFDSTHALALGILPGETFPVSNRRLQPGETAVVYTDGVTDAENHAGELFGEQRLQLLIRDAFSEALQPASGSPRLLSSPSLVDLVWSSVADFSGSVPPTDDKTLLVVRRLVSP